MLVESEVSMGRLHQIGNVFIRIYANDHLPPHFHIVGPDHQALVEIATLAIVQGKIVGKAMKEAMEWADQNRTAIAAEWNRTNSRFPVA